MGSYVSALLAPALVFSLMLQVGAHAQKQVPSFRSAVDLVSLNVTATDAAGRYVTDLAATDFSLYEDGVQQDLTLFNKSSLPIALALVLDTSSSMEARMATAQEAAIGFVRHLRPVDSAEVVEFDSRVQVLQPFTKDRETLERAIRQTAAGGSTSLYNAVYIALKELQKVKATQTEEIRREAIVVLSDGEDTSSLVTFDELLDLARRSETAIFCIGLQSRDTAQSRGFREATFALRQLAGDTGGRAFFVSDIKQLAGVYEQINDELSSQYTLGYSSKNNRRDGSWRRIVVRTKRPSVTVRTKQGYYGPTH
jgi:Ca-activated chloride channel homolog